MLLLLLWEFFFSFLSFEGNFTIHYLHNLDDIQTIKSVFYEVFGSSSRPSFFVGAFVVKPQQTEKKTRAILIHVSLNSKSEGSHHSVLLFFCFHLFEK